MTARHQLLDCYDQWRAWTRRETDAIRAEDWPAVNACQTTKESLQRLILQWSEAAETELRSRAAEWGLFQAEVRRVIGELIQLETDNGQLLSEQKRAMQARQRELEQASHNLRRVRGSYAGGLRSAWHSYS